MGDQGRVQTDLGHMPLLGSVGRVLWGSQAKTRLVNSNWKRRTLVTSVVGFYLRGTQWKGPGRQGELFIPGTFGKIRSWAYTCWWHSGLLSRVCAWMEVGWLVSVYVTAGCLAKKRGCQGRNTWRRLAKLWTERHVLTHGDVPYFLEV